MSGEMEALGAAALGGLTSRQTADLSGHACRNCGATVEARYCPVCGQLAASFHRPFWALIGETITDTLALDGRIARTLPLLFLRPGRLTFNYTSGQRARYVPPFRLFLLASLVFYFTLFAVVGNADWFDDLKLNLNTQDAVIQTSGGEVPVQAILQEDGTINRERALEALEAEVQGEPRAERVLNEAFDIVDNPERFLDSLQSWAPRLSLFLLPITVLTLALLHFWRRRVFIYDHAIHALHLHTWLYLSFTIIMVLGQTSVLAAAGWIIPAFILYLIIYLIRSLAVSTRASTLLSIIRFFILFSVWVVSISILAIALVIVGAIEA